jgi:hypothetical protein
MALDNEGARVAFKHDGAACLRGVFDDPAFDQNVARSAMKKSRPRTSYVE